MREEVALKINLPESRVQVCLKHIHNRMSQSGMKQKQDGDEAEIELVIEALSLN